MAAKPLLGEDTCTLFSAQPFKFDYGHSLAFNFSSPIGAFGTEAPEFFKTLNALNAPNTLRALDTHQEELERIRWNFVLQRSAKGFVDTSERVDSERQFLIKRKLL